MSTSEEPRGQGDAYTPLDEDAMGEAFIEGDDDAILEPDAGAFASPGTPSATGGEDPSGDNAEPQPED